MEFEFKIGWCPFCDQGWAEIVKDLFNKNLVVMCSECYTIWNTPMDFINNIPHEGHQFVASFADATLEEIKEKEWAGFIISD